MKLLCTLLATSLTLGLASTSLAKKNTKEVKPTSETFTLDTKESKVEWKGFKKIGSSHHGLISVKSGSFTVENNQVKTGQVVVDMATITNIDVEDKDYNKKLVGHLSNEDFFNVAKNPTSEFKITSITAGKNANEFTVKGELTMIGKTNPIEFPATIKIENGVATGEATVKIERTKWGLKYGSSSFFKELAGDKIITDEFELKLSLKAKK